MLRPTRRHAPVLIIASVAAITIGAASSQSLAGAAAFSQRPIPASGNSFPSDVNAGQQADNFSLASSSSIIGLRWWGTAASNAGPGAFTARFFADNAGLPGPLLTQFSIGNSFTQTATGITDFNGRDIFRFEASLGSGFSAAPAATYWISIVNDQSVVGPPLWLWYEGLGGNSQHAFRIGAGAWSTLAGDMAFELIIPSPGALALLALGAIGARRRWR